MSLRVSPYWHRVLTSSQPSPAMGPGNPADSARFAEIGKVISDEFVKSTGGALRGFKDAWGHLVAGHASLCERIEKADHFGVSELIADLHRNPLGTGMRWPVSWSDMMSGGEGADLYCTCLLDRTFSLCEALGRLEAYNPEDGVPPRDHAVEALYQKIDEHLGYEASSPGCYSLAYGALRPSGKTIDDRALQAIHTSERAFSLLAALGVAPQDAHVVEIGGGIGNLAYHMLKRGIGRYTLVDIPTVRAIQTYMALYEFPGMDVNFESAGVRNPHRLDLVTSDALKHLPDKSVQVVINEDSLTEIQADVAMEYLQEIARATSGYFLSINHESTRILYDHAQTPVAKLVEAAPQLRRLGRWRHWMRPGYVEEIFMTKPASDQPGRSA
jgi:hypothetical protein